MDRRKAISYITTATGVTLSAGFITGFLSGCKTENSETYAPQFLNQDEFHLLSEVAEIIIPETDTPGAKSMNLVGMMDDWMKHCYSDNEKDRASKLIADITEAINIEEFNGKNKEEKMVILNAMYADKNNTAYDSLKEFKAMVGTCYLATEHVNKELLNYLSVPGEYEACIPYNSNTDKAWAI